MIRRVRSLTVLARPALIFLVALFTATGVAQAGHANSSLMVAKSLVSVIALLLFAVAVNDIADERIDRVNLPSGSGRSLISGSGTRNEMAIVAITSAVLALAASLFLCWPAPLVVAGGIVFTAAYSLRPVRIAERGVLAPLLLPLGYVAIPYVLGIFAVRSAVSPDDLLLMVGLYAGFIGRILLKDFRDVRGDAMFGKRTFLVRHGRGPTCGLSAAFIVAGVSVLPLVRELTVALSTAYLVFLAVSLGLLRGLARSTSARRDETLISAFALVGRGMVITLYAHFAMLAAHWSLAAASAAMAALVLVVLASAAEMVRNGPRTRTVVPAFVDDPIPVR